MKRKYLICVNRVSLSCSLLLWVTGNLAGPANNTLISEKSESSNRLVSDLFAAKEGSDSAILECDFREAPVKTSCLNVMRNLNFEPKAVILKFITL